MRLFFIISTQITLISNHTTVTVLQWTLATSSHLLCSFQNDCLKICQILSLLTQKPSYTQNRIQSPHLGLIRALYDLTPYFLGYNHKGLLFFEHIMPTQCALAFTIPSFWNTSPLDIHVTHFSFIEISHVAYCLISVTT